MRAQDELDRRLAAWMTETTSGPPPAGRFEQAMAAAGRRRPRPRWLAAFGSDWVGAVAHAPVVSVWPGRRARLALATVVLIAIAVVGVGIFGHPDVPGPGVGGPSTVPTQGPAGTGTPLPSATPVPSTTPFPSATPVALPSAGTLAPGTYALANPCVGACADYQRIVFTLPAGWATSHGLVYKHLDQPGEVAFSAWTVDQVYADPCHWQASTMSPLDLANHSHDQTGAIILDPEAGGLANQALRGPTPRALTPVTLGGQSALLIDLSVPAGLDITTCDKGEFRSWTDVVFGANSHHAPGQLDTVYEVDVDRRPLVIDASHMPATTKADLAELESILASMFIDRGYPVETPSPASTGVPSATPPAVLTGPSGAAVVPGSLLVPGIYEYLDVDGQGFNIRFTVPAGWTWNGRYLSKGGDPPDGAAIYFFGGPVEVYADPCHRAGAQANPSPRRFAEEFMAALAAQPTRSLTTPIDRPADTGFANPGYAGMSVVLYVRGDLDLAACDGGQFRSWGPENKAPSDQGPGQRDLVWAVDVPGTDANPGGLIIDAASFYGTPAAVISEIDAVLESIYLGHWG